MPENKLQHFVPRCHLKPFSEGGEGKSITLYNIGGKRTIVNAPLKGQCAKPYFYGDDLKLEKAFHGIEGAYAETVRNVVLGTSLSNDETSVLRNFLLLQHFRTEAALKRIQAFRLSLSDSAFSSSEEKERNGVDVGQRSLVIGAMKMLFSTREYLDDLKACLVSNDTCEPFVTSDDPVILTNRLYLQRLKSSAFGIANSGAILALALTPKLYFLLWDNDCYCLPDRTNNVISVKNSEDVRALNMMQYQRAVSNIYFPDSSYSSTIAEGCNSIPERVPSVRLYKMAESGTDANGNKIFKPIAEVNAQKEGSFMLLAQPHYATPKGWPKFIKWRSKLRSYHDGSAMGHMRRRHPALAKIS